MKPDSVKQWKSLCFKRQYARFECSILLAGRGCGHGKDNEGVLDTVEFRICGVLLDVSHIGFQSCKARRQSLSVCVSAPPAELADPIGDLTTVITAAAHAALPDPLAFFG